MKRLFAVLALLVLCAPAQAQTLDIVDAETVAIAYYKLAGLTPSFESWAEDTEEFHAAPLTMRDEVKAKEAARMRAAYTAFSPALNVLNVATQANIVLQEMPDPANAARSKYFLSWSYAKGDADFFPYEFRNSYFAIVPREMEPFQNAEINKDQYLYLKARIGRQKKATLILMLRANFAEADEPVHLRGKDFWALAANVAGVSIWDNEGSMLWENTAGWYVSPRTQSLNDLHVKKEGEQ